MPRLAAVDVGSNTVHALVADLVDDTLRDVASHVEMPSLGAAVAATGRIGEAKSAEVVGALGRVVAAARADGAEGMVAGATAAVRRASDAGDVLAACSQAIGFPVRLLSERAEAALSFRGASNRSAPGGRWLLADLGGGSTELVAGRGPEMEEWSSLELGSGVLGGRLSDPPAGVELQRLAVEVGRALGAVPGRANALVATGGTAANLPRALDDRPLPATVTADELQQAGARLGSAPAPVVAESTGLSPDRVRAMRAGVVVLGALLRRLGLNRLTATHEGLRHGMVLAYLERGDDWWRR
jgi:exopolyphosphatase/guanosine-5'-triphosphate,3'-diphosphate pyrophosphatase